MRDCGLLYSMFQGTEDRGKGTGDRGQDRGQGTGQRAGDSFGLQILLIIGYVLHKHFFFRVKQEVF